MTKKLKTVFIVSSVIVCVALFVVAYGAINSLRLFGHVKSDWSDTWIREKTIKQTAKITTAISLVTLATIALVNWLTINRPTYLLNNYIKITISCVVLAILILTVSLIANSLIVMDYTQKYLRFPNDFKSFARVYYRARFAIITTIFTTTLLCLYCIFLWAKPKLIISITPGQAAERKRMAAERKKAMLQEKLNKLSD